MDGQYEKNINHSYKVTSIHFNKTEITTVLPDGKIIEINL